MGYYRKIDHLFKPLHLISYTFGLGGYFTKKGINRFNKIFFVFSIVNLAQSLLNVAILLIKTLSGHDNGKFVKSADLLCSLMGCIVSLFRSVTIFVKRDEIMELFDDVRQIWPREEDIEDGARENIERIIRMSVKLIYGFTVLSLNLVFAYIMLSIVDSTIISVATGSFPFKLPIFDYIFVPPPKTLFAFILLYIMEIHMGVTAAYADPCTQGIVIIFLTALTLESIVLRTRIQNISNDIAYPSEADIETYNIRLNECIERHANVYRLTKKMQRIFNTSFAVQFTLASVVICVLILAMVMADFTYKLKYVLYLSSTMSMLLMTCWCVEELIKETQNICDGIYACDWWKCDKSFKSKIIVFQILCETPLKFSPLSVFILSLGTFIAISKTAYSFYALLHTFFAE